MQNREIAFDIVIIPPADVFNKCLEINRQLETDEQKIVLGRESTLPHISLCMGVCSENELTEITAELSSIEAELMPVDVRLTGIEPQTNFTGHVLSYLMVEKTRALQTLHETIMHRFERFTGRQADSEMLSTEGAEHPPTLKWITGYREKSAFEHFSPHITLGYGRYNGEQYSAEFQIETTGFYHLGDHCTCQVNLKPG